VLLANGAGATINARASHGFQTALHNAADGEYLDIVNILIKAGATVNANDSYNQTPLHKAAKRRNLDVVKVLLTEGAKVDAKDYSGSMPLHETEKNYGSGSMPLCEKMGV
jgi:ankyrin repeat protein